MVAGRRLLLQQLRYRVLKARRELRVPLALLDLLVLRAKKVKSDLLVLKVFKVSKAQLVLLVLKAKRVKLVPKAYRVFKA
tara:strand:- start:481 stop:720 length:240 start_codon:yes stop_codon:yes gene_type:complete